MNLTKRIIACICIGLGTLMYFFFKHYTGGHIPYPFLFWLLGIALALTGMYLYRTSSSVKQFSKDNSVKQVIADLKKNGEQIMANLNDVEIKQNDYFKVNEERNTSFFEVVVVPEYRGAVQLIGSLSEERKSSNQIEVDQAVLVYKHIKDGKEERFNSPVIPKNRETLLFKLMAQKTTTIFVDQQDRSKYYFDVAFLFD